MKSSKKRIVTTILLLSSACGLCAAGELIQGVASRADYPEIITWADEEFMQSTDVMRYYRSMGWRNNTELIEISYNLTPGEYMRVFHTIDEWMPNIRALKNGQGAFAVISKKQIEDLVDMFMIYSKYGSASLQCDISTELNRVQLNDFVGLTMNEAWLHLHAIWGEMNPPPVTDFSAPPGVSQQNMPFHEPTFISMEIPV